jgi:hypothetical protein
MPTKTAVMIGLSLAKQRVLVALAAFLLIAFTPLGAPAQPAADAVYEDAKEIITELIERDVAESMATNLACYSPGGMLKYFPQTLQAAYERNFGALKDVLREESIRLAGQYAFESFRQGRSIPLREFLPMAPFNPADRDEKCVKEIARLGGPAAYNEQEQAEVRRRNQGNYLPMDECAQPAGPPKAHVLPCLFAQAVISSALGRHIDAEELLGVAVGTAVSEVLAEYRSTEGLNPEALLQAALANAALKTTLIEEVRTRFASGKFMTTGPLAAFTGPDLAQALELATKPIAIIWGEPSSSRRIRTGALHLLLAPADSPVASIEDGQLTHLLQLLPALKAQPRSSLAPAPGEQVSAALARALIAQAGVVPAGTVTVTEADNGLKFAFDATSKNPVTFVGSGIQRLVELYEMVEQAVEYQRLLNLLEPSAERNPQKEAILRGVIGLVQGIDALGGALSTAGKTADGGFDLLTLLDSVVRGQFVERLCTASKPATPAGNTTPVMHLTMCGMWRQATGLLDPEGNLRPIVAAARERNYRALAVAAVSAIFSSASTEDLCCGKDASCYASVELYGRLAKSITSYVLMPRDDQDASLAARAAFKSAAVDVIREIGKRGGVERPARVPWVHQLTAWIPTLSMRASWSGSYRIIDPGQDSVRVVPTVDYPTIRFRLTKQGSPIYVAGVINLIDPLAPLTELVTRDPKLNYSDEWWFWIGDIVHPRLSATIALPALTKNTAITIGLGFRGSAAFAGTRRDDAGMAVETYGYRTLWRGQSSDVTFNRGNNLYERLFEASVGVQYVP